MTPAGRAGPARRHAARAREVLIGAGYSGPRIAERLGVDDMRALDRLAGPVLARRLDSDSPLDVLVRLLLLGVEVERDVVRAVLHAPFEAWEGLGLVETTAGRVRARYRLVPHGDLLLRADWPAFPGRPLRPDHVLGPNPTASLLADITVRPRLGSVLDLGTGCGIQALLAARHADRVVASDLNPRAVGMAAFNAALNGIDVDCVEGDLFEPVRGQRFDLVVSNPPFVISPDTSLLFRDSALGGEGISRRIISDVAGLLNETGFCQLLTNWAHVEGVDWRGRLEEAFAGCGCNAWVLELDRAEPDIYAGRWIQPGTRTAPVFAEALDHWMRYYERERITAISWCAVTMRRASGPRTWIELDEMPAPIRAPAGDHVLRCFDARELLAGLADDALLAIRPRLAPDTRLEHQLSATGAGWAPVETRVRLTGGLPVEQAVDPGVANLLLHSDGRRSVRELLALAAGEAGVPTDALAPAGVGVIRRLLADAFLLPC